VKVDTENPAYSFVSITFKLDGEEYTLKSVKYSDNVERAMVEGNHPVPLAMTRGRYKAEASSEMFMQDFNAILEKMGDTFYTKTVPISVAYAEEGQDTVQDELVGAKFKKRERDHSNGNDALSIPMDLDLLWIRWNGKDPFPQMPGQ
jgi:hypothetical protein